jgi:predicted DNA-binding ribbon-helix-helix protein
MIALVQNHPLCEYIKEHLKDGVAYCTVKRRGEDEYTYQFSTADAKTAGLIGKAGVWQQYPNRMLQMRARGFALRDKFSDILKGIAMREEVEDYQVIDSVEVKTAAQEKISNLLANKNVNLLDKIENANSVEDLKTAKNEITTLLKDKHAQLIKNEEPNG